MAATVSRLVRVITRLERRAAMMLPAESVPALYIVAVEPVRDSAGKLKGCDERLATLCSAELGACEVAEFALYQAMREHGLNNVTLARKLGKGENEVRRMLDLDHATRIETLEDALRLLGKKIVADMQANNEPIPTPRADHRYSGKVTSIRPADEAEEEQIGLTRLVSARVSMPLAVADAHRFGVASARKVGALKSGSAKRRK
jgi:hypothetical protein